MSMNKSCLFVVLIVVAMTTGQLQASAASLQSLIEQESAPSGISICINAEAHPESIEFKVKCLSSLMNEFYTALNSRQYKKAFAYARVMNKFEPLHPDMKEFSSEIDTASNELADGGHAGMFASAKPKRRTFFVGK